MKIRRGFVSNSSSMNYIVDVDLYPSVRAVARAACIFVYQTYDNEYLNPIYTLAWLDEMERQGIDPDTTIRLPSSCDFTIMRAVDYYEVVSDWNYTLGDLDGFRYYEPDLDHDFIPIMEIRQNVSRYKEEYDAKSKKILQKFHDKLIFEKKYVRFNAHVEKTAYHGYKINISKNNSYYERPESILNELDPDPDKEQEIMLICFDINDFDKLEDYFDDDFFKEEDE